MSAVAWTLVLASVLIMGALGALATRTLERARAAARIDRVTRRAFDVPDPQSRNPEDALARLERAVEQRITPSLSPRAVDRYEAVLASLTLGVIVLDERGDVLFRNPFAASFLEGRHGQAVVGSAIAELISVALAGEPAEREVQLFAPPRRTFFITASPIGDDARRLGAVVLIDDITEQERLDAIRRDFVANISHELRTPIGAMALLAETLEDERDPEVIASLSARIRRESERLAHTVDDLLQLSRIEHGSDEGYVPVVVQSVIATANDRVRNAAEHANVEIGVVAPSQRLMVRGDALQLQSALFNLLDNAVKYIGHAGGTISIRARRSGADVEIVVQDSGIGIPRRDLDRIFERFYRVDQGRSRSSGGTGLGLAIVRHVVANHGGRVAVESTEGEGTTFTLQLPALAQNHDDPGDDQPDVPQTGAPTTRE